MQLTKKQVKELMEYHNINIDSISFYSRLDDADDGDDVEFGYCEFTEQDCELVWCTARDSLTGAVIEFRVDHELVHGHLGELAGAF